jgi:PD-(D/E)XK nuclease superfamily
MPKVIPIAPVKSWSFSRYSDYMKCPAFFKYKHLDKIAEPPNPAMQRGTDIHAMAEKFVKGELKKLPKELELFADDFQRVRGQQEKVVEESWAFKSDWSLTTWNDWNGCWLRVKMDLCYVNHEHNVAVPIDHKTGKCRDEEHAKYGEQLELYAIATLLQMPHVDVVSPRLWYLDHGVIFPDPEKEELEITRKDLPKLQKKWEKKVAPMFKDTVFKATPSATACRWCHYRQSNGGPCTASRV